MSTIQSIADDRLVAMATIAAAGIAPDSPNRRLMQELADRLRARTNCMLQASQAAARHEPYWTIVLRLEELT